MADARNRLMQSVTKPSRACAIVLHEMKGDTLRRLGSDTRQATQGVSQQIEAGG